MTLLFIDGFDHYAVANPEETGRKWGLSTGSGIFWFAGTGRSGSGQSLGLSSENAYAQTPIAGTPGTLILGFAARVTDLPGIKTYIGRFDGEGTTYHALIAINPSGVISLTSNSGADLGVFPAVNMGDWNYFEFKFTVGASGAFEMRMNGDAASAITGTGDLFDSGASTVNFYRLRGGSSTTIYYDDLYICDTNGTENNDFLGPVSVVTLYPDGDVVTDWTPVGAGTTSADRVDDTIADDTTADSAYLQTSAAGDEARLTFGALGTSDTVLGVQVSALARKVDLGGTRTARTTLNSNITKVVGATTALSSSYAYLKSVHEQDPDTTAAWIEAGVDALEAGVEVVA